MDKSSRIPTPRGDQGAALPGWVLPSPRRGAYPPRQGLRKHSPLSPRARVDNNPRRSLPSTPYNPAPAYDPRMPVVPSTPCPTTGCPHLRPCPDHTSTSWAGARDRRRAKTGLTGHAEQRRAKRILHRYGSICHVCHEGAADEVDHVIPLAEGGEDHEDNLRPIHRSPCHLEKTRRERERGRARARGEVTMLDLVSDRGGGGVPPRPATGSGSRGAARARRDEFPTRLPEPRSPRRGTFGP